ncbi:MAG: hypothetical protein M1595_01950 [Candidatus Thermoplasmatota archaeon]|jgi:extradiol dioxygenase family protein|nr:hypothetical protein [Candidatus Thermoplasmatota archaeon]
MLVTDPDAYIPRLFRVILPVNDIEKAQKFYSSLLNVEVERGSPEDITFSGAQYLRVLTHGVDGDNFDLPPNPETHISQ